MCVDAGNTKHEDGGGDENDVEAGESDEDAVDRVLHLGPEHQVCLIPSKLLISSYFWEKTFFCGKLS